jgi:hypothetical protein
MGLVSKAGVTLVLANHPHLAKAFPGLHRSHARLVIGTNYHNAVATLCFHNGTLRDEKSTFGNAGGREYAPEHSGSENEPRIVKGTRHANGSRLNVHLAVRKHDPALLRIQTLLCGTSAWWNDLHSVRMRHS